MDTTKITAKIYEPLWISFKKDAASLFLARDPFLNHIIRLETPRLAEELGSLKVSAKAKRFIAARLKSMGKIGAPRQVSIVVEKKTADALNKVVENSNLVRDAFINRLLLLLRASDALLNYFGLPLDVDDPALHDLKPTPTSPFRAMRRVRDDPFLYLREFAQEKLDCGLYLLPMPPKLYGLCCYLDDELVPGTGEWSKGMKTLDSLLSLETSAFASTKKGRGKP